MLHNVIQLETVYGSFLMNRHDRFQPHSILTTGRPHIDSEIQTILQVVGHLDPHAIVVDAGANIGLIAVPVAHALKDKGGCVHAFEPQRQIYYLLAGNTALGGLDNLYCHQLALGEAEKSAFLPPMRYDQPADFGMVSILDGTEAGEAVRVVTLDSLALPRVDMMKVDVEQMELALLQGAADTIARCRPIIWIEIWPQHYAKIFAWLTQRGYVLMVIDALNFCAVLPEHLAKMQFAFPIFDGQNNPYRSI